MDTINNGWDSITRDRERVFSDKIRNYRHDISVWRKNNLPYGREKINELQQGLNEIQNDDTKTEAEVKELMDKLKEAYMDKELYWQQKRKNYGINWEIVI